MTLFNIERKDSYLDIHEQYPCVRQAEIDMVLRLVNFLWKSSFSEVLEIGSGNGFLTSHLRKNFSKNITTLDPVFGKTIYSKKHYKCDLNYFLELPDIKDKYNLIVSLAVFHHIANKEAQVSEEFFNFSDKHILEHGAVIIFDVAPFDILRTYDNGSFSAYEDCKRTGFFFKYFVGKYATPNHKAYYPFADYYKEKFLNNGFKKSKHGVFSCHWQFDNLYDAYLFVKGIFNLKIGVKKVEREFVQVI